MGKLLKTYLMPHPPIMVHEVGRGSEREVQNTIDGALRVADEVNELKPDTIIILVPPHGPAFSDAMAINTDSVLKGSLSNFNAPGVSFEFQLDTHLTDLIMRQSVSNNIPVAPIDSHMAKRYRIQDRLDHGSIVPLYFIKSRYSSFKLVHITYGLLSNEELYHFGRIIREAVDKCDGNVVFIASGDLSHRLTYDAPAGYTPQGKVFDEKIVKLLEVPDIEGIMDMDRELIESAGECGYRSIICAMGTLDGFKAKGEVYSYEGPFGVGYCIAGFSTEGEADSCVDSFVSKRKKRIESVRAQEDEYVRLARESLEYYIRNNKHLPIPDGLPEEMLKSKAGVFVSLKKDGKLRGCIGTIQGVQGSIADEIIENAISAGTSDPRFYPVDEDELDYITYSVDVLGKAEPVDSKEELDPVKYGVIVRKGRRSGLLLPNLEGVDTVDEQIRIALSKAGIGEDEDYSMERFEVIRHR